MNLLAYFLAGGIAVENAVIAMFFYRYQAKTADRFFGIFALAFLLLAVERIVWLLCGRDSELMPYVYLFRLAAFSLIIAAIALKNLPSDPRSLRVPQ